MDERDGFYFHRSFRDAIDQLPQKDQLALYRAITRFGLDGIEPDKLTPTQNAFYLLVRPVLAKGRNKAANGKQGGSRRKQTVSKPKANGKQTESKNESASDLLLSDNNSDSESDKGQGSNPTDYDKGQGSNPTDYDFGRWESAPAPVSGREFTEFWNEYPAGKGGDREEAWNAWKELSPSTATAWRILDALREWKGSAQWAECSGRYIPNAAKFLREKRWMAAPDCVAECDNQSGAPFSNALAYANRLIAARGGGEDSYGE